MTENQMYTELNARHPEPGRRLRVVMDTDIANEIDDHFSLSEMLLSPERFDVRAVIAAPYLNERVSSHAEGMEKSYQELLKMFSLLNLPTEGMVFRGASRVMDGAGHAVDSPGARRLIELAHEAARDGEKLYVIGIAAATDIASALLLDPSIAGEVAVYWLGGHSPGPWENNEFNRIQDVFAADLLCSGAVELVHFPCRCMAELLIVSAEELEKRCLGSPLLDYLREHTLAEMRFYGNDTRSIWDVAPVAYLLQEKNFMWEELSIPGGRYPITRVRHLKRDAIMGHLFQTLRHSISR